MNFDNAILEEGEHSFTVKNAEEKISSKGNEMVEIVLKVKNRLVKDFLVGPDKIIQFLESIGRDEDIKKREIKAANIIGCSGACAIFISQDEKYGAVPKISKYIKPPEETINDAPF